MNNQTNEEFVVELMNFSPYGALSQIFIIEAISYYSKCVIDEFSEKDLKDQRRSLIDNKAWLGVANYIETRLRKKYNYEKN